MVWPGLHKKTPSIYAITISDISSRSLLLSQQAAAEVVHKDTMLKQLVTCSSHLFSILFPPSTEHDGENNLIVFAFQGLNCICFPRSEFLYSRIPLLTYPNNLIPNEIKSSVAGEIGAQDHRS